MFSLIGAVNQTSYGLVTSALNHFLTERGIKLALFPVNGDLSAEEKYQQSIKESLDRREFFPYSKCVRIFHQFSMDFFAGKERIGFPIFELDEFSPIEKHHLSSLDRVLVCSEWAKNIIQSQFSSIPTHVVPLGVDTDIFYPSCNSAEGPTIFLNVGKTEIRKGHDLLIKAFNRAFSSNDSVELWTMWQNPAVPAKQVKEWERLYTASPLSDKIKFIPRVKSQSEVCRYMQRATVGVFPSRAEGWNLPILEMMACGKTSIVTNCTGHTEYCSNENSFLIEAEEMEVAYDGVWFNGKYGKWHKPRLDHLIESMRHCHKLNQENNLSNLPHTLETAKRFSWQNSVEKLLKCIT